MDEKQVKRTPYLLLLLALGHLVADMHGGGLPLFFPLLKDTYHLSYTQLGTLMLVSQMTSSVIQPVFGVLSDGVSTRWIMPVSLLVATLGMGILGFAPSYSVVTIGVIVMGIGIAAYHPESSKIVHDRGGAARGKAMSTFALGGNVGLAAGPVLAGLGIAWLGIRGAVLFIPVTLIVVHLFRRATSDLYDHDAVEKDVAKPKATVKTADPTRWGVMGLLLLVIIVRSGANASLMTFIPLYFTDNVGHTAVYSSMLLTVFLIAGALGTAIGGPLSDRFGTRTIIAWSLILSGPLIAFIPTMQAPGFIIPLLVLTGFILLSSFAVTTVLGQSLMPHHIGLASGLTLGFSAGTGGISVTLLGWIGDQWGLEAALTALAIVTALGGVLALKLPKMGFARERVAGTDPAATIKR